MELARELIAANVRALMARRRVTQTVLAGALKMTQQALSRRLNGAVAFDTDELMAVAAYFDEPITKLLEGVQEAVDQQDRRFIREDDTYRVVSGLVHAV